MVVSQSLLVRNKVGWTTIFCVIFDEVGTNLGPKKILVQTFVMKN